MKSRVSRFASLALLALLCVGRHALALDDPNRITLPTAASIVGAAPFFSDVRVFNTSYDSTISLEATYRCFIGSCPAVDRGLQIVVGPRETKAFNDMVGVAFSAPNSAGGIEFEVTAGGSAVDIGITSRLYSTSPQPTVGMFVPGVLTSAAQPVTFLGQIANGGAGSGFRTNAGAFNGGDVAGVRAVRRVRRQRASFSGSVTRHDRTRTPGRRSTTSSARSAAARESINDAVIVVTVERRALQLRRGDRQPDHGSVPRHRRRGRPGASRPRSAAGAHADPDARRPRRGPPRRRLRLPQGQTVVVNVGEGGLNFVDQASGSNMTRIHVGDTVRWVWVGGSHSTTSGSCSGGCHADGLWDSGTGSGKTFERKFTQAGTFPYHCIPHGAAMTGTVVVQ